MPVIGEKLRAAWSMVGLKKEEGHAIYYRFHDCDGYLALLCKSFQLPALSGLVGWIHLGIKEKHMILRTLNVWIHGGDGGAFFLLELPVNRGIYNYKHWK